MNQVNLIGRLTRDIETRQTQSGKQVSNFTLAVNNTRRDDDTSFINCILWEHDGLLPYLTKGKEIGLTGRINTRSYEGRGGNKVFVTEVIAFSLDLLGGNTQENNQAPKPRPQNKQSNNPFGNTSFEEPEDDLPF